MDQEISFKDMLKQIESAKVAFSLSWVKLSMVRKEGGQIKSAEELLLYRTKHRGGESPNPKRKKKSTGLVQRQYFNLHNPTTGEYIKIYKRLIIRFNGYKVTY